ncbi:MAG TPA: hypothetical protein VGT03_15765 [Candidatus Acidoferrales bacterium]|nr:hypothetical protein [Candidatus Acidoferrales bacterium]
MTRNKPLHLLAVALALVLAIPALAASKAKKDPKPIVRSNFELVGNEMLNGTALKPGIYVVTADESKVTFWRDDKLVAEAPIQWQTLMEVTARNTLVLDSGKIQEIRFAGRARSVKVQ